MKTKNSIVEKVPTKTKVTDKEKSDININNFRREKKASTQGKRMDSADSTRMMALPNVKDKQTMSTGKKDNRKTKNIQTNNGNNYRNDRDKMSGPSNFISVEYSQSPSDETNENTVATDININVISTTTFCKHQQQENICILCKEDFNLSENRVDSRGGRDRSINIRNLNKEGGILSRELLNTDKDRSKNKTKTNQLTDKDRGDKVDRRGKTGKKRNKTKKGNISIIHNSEESKVYCHSKIDKENLSYLVTNTRGYSSKRAAFTNILNASDFDFVMVTETHLYEGRKPSHPDYTFVGRSRKKVNSKGGVAIGYKKSLAQNVVKVAEGKGKNEFILLKCTAYEPELIIGVVYGSQEGTTPENEITENLAELFNEIDKYKDEGLNIVVAGDFNLHIGEYIKGNDKKISKGGKKLIELCEDFGMEIMNKKSDPDNNHTHFDITSKTSRILDLAISNMDSEHIRLEVDKEKKVTPFVTRYKNGEWTNSYTDHLSLIGEVMVQKKKGKKKKKMKMWKMSRPGGKEKYYELTDKEAENALKIIQETESNEEMYDELEKLIGKIKDEAYGVRTITKKRREREEKEKLLMKRKCEIEENIEGMKNQGKRINEQIFMTRNQINSNDDDEIIEAIDHYKTGERLTDPDRIIESILDYNEEVLKKKEDVNEEVRERRDDRKEAVDFFKTIEDQETEEPLKWEEFLKVTKKVMTINKGCYKDFTLAGPRWKTVMFEMFQRIYMTEEIPEKFKKTKLKKLYKKKGDKSKLSSYRFIHLKNWAGKMMEKLVLEKAEAMVEVKIPEMQIGGQKKCNTVEHLMTVMTRGNIGDKEKKAVIIQLLDIVKCFDKVLLSDTLHDLGEAGVFGKRLRMIEKLHEDTKISLANDPKEREKTIKNSTGQGTNWAPSGCARTIAESTKRAVEEVDNEIKIKGKNRGTIIFVDDTARIAEDTKMARDGGKVFTKALDELSLEAHPDKSKIVVMGSKKLREETKKELEENPVIVQGWEMKTSENETYLGYQINEKGTRESKNKSIETRARLARTKSIQLMKILEDRQIQEIGWLESAKLLFTSIIIPTLTYGSQTYTFMNKKQEALLEGAMRENLYRMLELSRTAHYASVLFEMNLIPIRAIIDQLKIGWLNSLIHEKGFGTCLETIREEEEKFPGEGIIGEVRKLCEKYNLPDVNLTEVCKERIKENVWRIARNKLWDEMLNNRRAPYSHRPNKIKKDYWNLPKLEARLVLAYKTGELNFKEFKKREMTRIYGNTNCFVTGCREKDTIWHVMQCEGYTTKIKNFKQDGQDKLMAPYLRALDMERWRLYECGLIYRRERKPNRKAATQKGAN